MHRGCHTGTGALGGDDVRRRDTCNRDQAVTRQVQRLSARHCQTGGGRSFSVAPLTASGFRISTPARQTLGMALYRYAALGNVVMHGVHMQCYVAAVMPPARDHAMAQAPQLRPRAPQSLIPGAWAPSWSGWVPAGSGSPIPGGEPVADHDCPPLSGLVPGGKPASIRPLSRCI